MSDSTGMTLLGLPWEMRHHIFKFVNPEDLSRIALVCKDLQNHLAEDRQLDKEIISRLLDGPCEESQAVTFDYRQYLRDSVKYTKILGSTQDVFFKTRYSDFIAKFADTCLGYALPIKSPNIGFLYRFFGQSRGGMNNVEAFLCQSITYCRAARGRTINKTPRPYAIRQASAKLHVLYGVAQLLPQSGSSPPKYTGAYGYGASMVYDLRNYKAENFWGPYRDTGDAQVDWEKLEAIMIVLSYNLRQYRYEHPRIIKPHGARPFLGASPGSFKHGEVPSPHLEKGSLDDPFGLLKTGKDPYNVTGTYQRVVCFLDFHDLFAFNFTMGQPRPDEPRPAIRTTEAIRIIRMEITARSVSTPDPEDGQDLPVVHFDGVSRSMLDSWDPNANSAITGTVRMTKEGEVRWSTLSVYGGESRWKSEGIQIGGINSARGVMGYWFDKDYGQHGPAGPTMFWKISNDITDHSAAPSSRTTTQAVLISDDEDDLDMNEDYTTTTGQDDATTTGEELMEHLLRHGHGMYVVNEAEDEDEDEEEEEEEEEENEFTGLEPFGLVANDRQNDDDEASVDDGGQGAESPVFGGAHHQNERIRQELELARILQRQHALHVQSAASGGASPTEGETNGNGGEGSSGQAPHGRPLTEDEDEEWDGGEARWGRDVIGQLTEGEERLLNGTAALAGMGTDGNDGSPVYLGLDARTRRQIEMMIFLGRYRNLHGGDDEEGGAGGNGDGSEDAEMSGTEAGGEDEDGDEGNRTPTLGETRSDSV